MMAKLLLTSVCLL